LFLSIFSFLDFQKNSSVDNEGRVQIPPMETLEKLCEEVKKWDEVIYATAANFLRDILNIFFS